MVLWYRSGNQDEDYFTNATAFDITREPNPHVTFGSPGPHHCLGANLARLELSVTFRVLFELLPDIRAVGPPDPLRSNFLHGIKHLRAEFTPVPRPAVAAMSVESAVEAAVLHGDGDGIRRITLNRPEAANALRPVDRDRLIELLQRGRRGPRCPGRGDLSANGRHFCSGADVTGIARSTSGDAKRATDSMRKIMNGAQRLVAAVLDCGKPVIAVVNGAAAGIGAHLALAADLVVAAEDASFVEVFVRRGLVVDGGGAYLLPRRIGMQKAKELAFFGDKLPAAEALALGMVNRVVPAAELDAAADEFARRLAAAPTTAISLTKRLLNASPDGDRAAAFLAEAMAQEIQSAAEDSREGVRSFIERRPPEFRGF